ncbi:type II secretion system protein J [Parapedobacter deserti]|uniref:Type II secretion system protein J n=1 Tax=Parapedobacter deserti TaxID=1912957 RepID=A0ABV7JKD1_9SPHI
MSIHQHKLQAFTIIETMIALVLTALTISFVYAGIRFAQRQGDTMAQQLESFGEFNRLHRALQADTKRSGEIRYRDSELSFLAGDRIIEYVLGDSLCIRHEGFIADTFHIRIDSVASWYDRSRLKGTTGLLADQAALYVQVRGRSLPITIYKQYDAATLMQLTQIKE